MKKPTLVLILALTMIAASTVANGAQMDSSVDGQYSQVMTAMNTGGNFPAEIVVGQTNLSDVTQAMISATVMMSALDASGAGSDAQLFANVKPLADTASSGGSSFHVGKRFVAPTPAEAAGCMTSIAT